MPRSNAAESLSYDSSVDHTMDDSLDSTETGLDTVNEESDLTTPEDALRSEISNTLEQIDSLEQRLPETSKVLLEKGKEKLMKLLETGKLSKAKDFSSILADSLKAEAKFHEQFKNKKDEIDFRLNNGFSLVAGTSESTMKKVKEFYDDLKNKEAKGNFSGAALLADKILDLFHTEHVHGETDNHAEQKKAKAEQKLTKLKDQLSEILKTIPNWRDEKPFIAQGLEKIYLDEQEGDFEEAGQTVQYLIDSLAGPVKSEYRKFNSRDEEEAVQFLEGVTKRLEYGKNLKTPIIPKATELAKIDAAKSEIMKFLNKGQDKTARDLAEKLLRTVQKGIPKSNNDVAPKPTRKGDTIKQTKEQRPELIRSNTLVDSVPDMFASRANTAPVDLNEMPLDALPITQKISLEQTNDTAQIDLAAKPPREVRRLTPSEIARGKKAELPKFSESTRLIRGLTREEVARNLRRLNRLQPSSEETPAELDHDEFESTATSEILHRTPVRESTTPKPVHPGLIDTTPRRALDRLNAQREQITKANEVALANSINVADFDDIIIPPKKGIVSRLRDVFRPKNAQEQELAAKEKQEQKKETWLRAIGGMDHKTVLENLKKFDINIQDSAPAEELKKVTKWLNSTGDTADIFKALWSRYLKTDNKEKNDWAKAIPSMDITDVYANMKKFGIDLQADEAKKNTQQKILDLRQEEGRRGELFGKLYDRYVELQNNKTRALEVADEKTVRKFLKSEYNIDTKKYLSGDPNEKAKVDPLRTEYNSYRRKVIDAGLTRLENLAQEKKSKSQKDSEPVPPTDLSIDQIRKLRTMADVNDFLITQGLSLDRDGLLTPKATEKFQKMTNEAAKNSKKEDPRLIFISAALDRRDELLRARKSKPFQDIKTFVGSPEDIKKAA